MRLRKNLCELINLVARPLGFELFMAGQTMEDNTWVDQVRLAGTEASTIFDVGGNLGQSVKQYRQLFPRAKIHTFEPFIESYTELKKVCDRCGHANAHHTAITDQSGVSRLNVNVLSGTNSLLEFSPKAGETDIHSTMATLTSTEVATTTLDLFCEKHGINSIDILKMDVQGSELKVLHGAASLLERQAIRLIYAEVMFDEMYVGQADFCEIRSYLASKDYFLYGLYYLKQNRGSMLGWGDAIFVSNAIRSEVLTHPEQHHLAN